MPSLRRHFTVSTGILLTLQVAGTGLAAATGYAVVRAWEQTVAVSAERQQMAELAEVVREQYVHEAHTFISQDASHLDHHDEVVAEVRARLAAVSRSAPSELAPEYAAVALSIDALGHHFDRSVRPVALGGGLDRETAFRLHNETERLASVANANIRSALAALDYQQSQAQRAASEASRRGWQVALILCLAAVIWTVLVGRRLQSAVSGPVDTLVAATTRFGETGEAVFPVGEGDEEIQRLAQAIAAMTVRIRESEAERVRAERLAALGEMSAAVAHELLNPLTVILADPLLATPAGQTVRIEADHARKVVQGLLGFARPGREAATVVALGEEAAAAVDRLLGFADSRGIKLTLRPGTLEARLPPSAPRHVLDNLIRNAIEASPDDAEVEVVVNEGEVVVMDRGVGVPASLQSRLYEPFATGRPDGVGLGLAVASRIVRAAGGTLRHTARPGGGTVAAWRVQPPA